MAPSALSIFVFVASMTICTATTQICCPVCSTCPIWDNYPIVRLNVTQDVWIEGSGNKGGYNFLVVGKHPLYTKKRILIQFEDIPNTTECQNIKWAKIYLKYWYSHKASWLTPQQAPNIPRTLQVHQIKKEWNETEATSINRLRGHKWRKPYVGLDDVEADASTLDTVIFTGESYVEFDITKAAQNWKSGDPNHGVLIWATNEDCDGRDIRFFSKEHSTGHPFLYVYCT